MSRNSISNESISLDTTIDPIYNPETGELMGVYGVSIDVTEKKQLKKERDRRDSTTMAFIEEIHHLMNQYKITTLHNKIGIRNKFKPIDQYKINLTKREKEILFYLSCNKSAKEISLMISTSENKNISHHTVHSIINKKLYDKFEVTNTSDLLEKAAIIGLIPVILH